MNSYFKYDFALQTFVEVDCQLSDLTKWISDKKYLEIGDDPRLVQIIVAALHKVQTKVKLLEPYFDLANIPLSKANIYFGLIKQVSETVQFLEEVRERDCGSPQYTRELLINLRLCINNLNAIGDLLMVEADLLQ
jgi:hypothetical protein